MKQYEVYLGLGSNVGRREEFLRKAVSEMKSIPGLRLIDVSSVYETDPFGKTDQPRFLNAVMLVGTVLEPQSLFSELKSVEARVGRTSGERWGPREIDIDILIYDGLVFRNEEVVVPHPDLEHRKFVLIPLREIAPDLVHPVSGMTVDDLANSCSDAGRVVRSVHHLLL